MARNEVSSTSPFIKLCSQHLFVIVIALALLTTCGCKETPATDWSEQAVSPDGSWTARASNQRGGGMGGAYNDATVRLKRKTGPSDEITILSFSNESQVADLKMEWVDSTHLTVSYPSYATIDFQAIKCAGINISVVEVQKDWPVPARPTHVPAQS
jgi:hypothetical protein